MKRLARFLSPWAWLKVLASSIALYVNAIQLSEVGDEWGHPVRGQEWHWKVRARLVAFEARQIRRHLGLVDD